MPNVMEWTLRGCALLRRYSLLQFAANGVKVGDWLVGMYRPQQSKKHSGWLLHGQLS